MKRKKIKLIKLLRNKLKSDSKGFSILEMLLAVVVLLLATQLVTQAMDIAAKRYIESTNRSKAQMIMSTLSDFVRNELTTGSDFALNDGDISFIDGSGILGGRCVLANDQSTVCLRNVKSGKSYYPIVGSNNGTAFNYANNLRVSFDLGSSKDDSNINFVYTINVEDKTGKELAAGKYKVTVKASEMD
ncbi:MAG: hypothetical protein K6E70_08350 [Butyrivibrio sp.]|nr:hypothetical protein [Butyrivibrio sp.]